MFKIAGGDVIEEQEPGELEIDFSGFSDEEISEILRLSTKLRVQQRRIE
jgi:hypothetical protein